jgi:hypothetical protein
MRTMIRTVLVALFAAFAVGAVSTASASASECPDSPTEGDVALCKGSPFSEQVGTFPFLGKKTAGTTMRIVQTGGWAISCQAANTEGASWLASDSTLEASAIYIKFTGCKVTSTTESEEKCTVHSPRSPDGTLLFSGGEHGNTLEDHGLRGSFTGANATSIRIAPSVKTKEKALIFIMEVGSKYGSCPFPTGKYNITGGQEGKTGTTIPDACEARTVHRWTFSPTESYLKLGSGPLTLELTADAELTSKEPWGLCPS